MNLCIHLSGYAYIYMYNHISMYNFICICFDLYVDI
jgi:hypothetical protein